MRISTNTMYARGAAALSRQQIDITKTQEQISSGRRINKPSDDPSAAARILDLTYANALTNQSVSNQNTAMSELSNVESALSGIDDILQNARDLAMQSNSATLSDSDKKSLAASIRGSIDSLTSMANSTDVSGQYIFGGFSTQTPPFVRSGSSTTYVGDGGSRTIAVSSSRMMRLNESGRDLFMNIPTGNGQFDATASPANTGTLVYNAGSVVNPADITGHGYRVDFSLVAGATTYAVTDTTSNSVVSSGQPFTASSGISIAGMSMQFSGNPANGDSLTIAHKPTQSVFKSLLSLAESLEAPSATPSDKSKVTNGVLAAIRNIDGAMSVASNTRISVGTRLSELDSLTQVSADAQSNFGRELSKLQDLDYASAISLLSMQKQQMEAAQQSYAKLFGLSLMSYLK